VQYTTNPVTGVVFPRMTFYPGAWGSTVFSQGHSPIKINQENLGILGAKTEIPNFANPYAAVQRIAIDVNSGQQSANPAFMAGLAPANGLIGVLVPWYPGSPGNGFAVPLSGTTNKTVQTAQIDFSGVFETYTVDFEYYSDPSKSECNTDADCNGALGYHCDTLPNHFTSDTHGAGRCTDNTIVIDAIECHDFLGEVFLCQDPQTKDLLSATMYSSGYAMLNWISNHPGSQDACALVVRYSPYNNYLDYISSMANGVTVSMTPGGGFGRVDDATLYNTAFESN